MMTKDFGFLILLRFYLLRFLLKAADAIPLKKARKKQCFLKGNLLWDTSYFICIRMIFCKRQPKQPPAKRILQGDVYKRQPLTFLWAYDTIKSAKYMLQMQQKRGFL